MVAKRTARSERIHTINQARSLALTGPDDIRVRFVHHTTSGLVADLAALRPRPGDVVGYATRIALRELGRRAGMVGSPPPAAKESPRKHIRISRVAMTGSCPA
jgi:hypothetical protein